MLEEQRLTKSEQKTTNERLRETNQRLDGLGTGFLGLSTAVQDLTSRVENMEGEQHVTNTILRQHSMDFGRIAELLSERVPHWGDDITIQSGRRRVSGTLKKAG